MNQSNVAQARFVTADGRVWEKICESRPEPKVEEKNLPILHIAKELERDMLVCVYEGHMHDGVIPEILVLYKNIDIHVSDIYAIAAMTFETNFTPVPPAAPKTPEELRAERFRRA